MKTITINNKLFKITPLKTLRAMMIFEAATNRVFELKTLTDTYLFYYLCLTTNNEGVELEWDEFIDFVESNPQELQALVEASKREDKINESLTPKTSKKKKESL